MKSKSFLPGACFLSALLTLPSVCHAIITGLCETDLPGLCSKSLDINASGSQITIVLSNTSPASNSGFITADTFNMPGNLGLTLASTTNANFQLSAGSIAVRPFPNTEFLLSATNNDWNEGGSPNGGIPVGGSATFLLNITGGTLIDNFANESAVFTSQLIRLRGFNGNPDSDKDTVTAVQVLQFQNLPVYFLSV